MTRSRVRRRARAAFTMVEIIVSLTIFGVVGLALTKMLLTQSAGFKRDVTSRRARSGARGSMNMIVSDLRMSQDVNGVALANDSTIIIKSPVVFGLVCANSAASTTIAAVAADSFVTGDTKYGGYGVRNPASPYSYTFVSAASSGTRTTGVAATCTGLARPIRADTVSQSGRTGTIVTFTPGNTASTAVGQPAFLWQYVAYRFRKGADSTRRLYRVSCGADTLSAGAQCTNEELLGPFSARARFNYFVTTATAASQDSSIKTAPADLNTIRGVEFVLAAISPDTVGSSKGPASATTTTSVFFKNVRIP
ncbi:MAG: prepilin-type N-terminal cleavage/methylation domain-containing protein [Gemmatimonadaceae bacterium]